MSIDLSTPLAQIQAAATAAALNGGFIRLFTAPRPAKSRNAETGTLLGIVTVGAVAGAGLHFVAVDGSIVKANEVWAWKALASGDAAWFRMVQPGDTGEEDPSAVRLDGDIGTGVTPTDMVWDSPAVTAGVTYSEDAFTYFIQPVG